MREKEILKEARLIKQRKELQIKKKIESNRLKFQQEVLPGIIKKVNTMKENIYESIISIDFLDREMNEELEKITKEYEMMYRNINRHYTGLKNPHIDKLKIQEHELELYRLTFNQKCQHDTLNDCDICGYICHYHVLN